MPELPDLTIYLETLAARVQGRRLEQVMLVSPFVLRSVDPPVTAANGRQVVALRRIGKRLVIGLEGELFLLIHLMIAGRLRWKARGAKPAGRITLAIFEFETGSLHLTEAGSQRRASIHLVHGEEALAGFDAGGLEVLDADLAAFERALKRENHTLKRALTDPRLFSGIGNSYSDEILHRARLSPFKLSGQLEAGEVERLFHATRQVLREWTERLRRETGGDFPEKVTAFRPEMAVHGRYRQPCPVCGAPVQRIVYAENEANYCPGCQTGGQILADRALSRLLKKEWPRTLEELEERRGPAGQAQ
jgi:formamidopyrimidine-DNA glycosylase